MNNYVKYIRTEDLVFDSHDTFLICWDEITRKGSWKFPPILLIYLFTHNVNLERKINHCFVEEVTDQML